MVGPLTRTCPSAPWPISSPTNWTSALRAWRALAEGQGWPGLHDPSSSRAAMPERRMRGPSAHQIGPSPSHTAVGVQSKAWPVGTTAAAARSMANGIVAKLFT